MATKVEQCTELIEGYTKNAGNVTNMQFLDKAFNFQNLSPEWAPIVHALDRLKKSVLEEPAKWKK